MRCRWADILCAHRVTIVIAGLQVPGPLSPDKGGRMSTPTVSAPRRQIDAHRPVVAVQKFDSEDWQLARELRLKALAQDPESFNASTEDYEHQPESFWRDYVITHGYVYATVDGAPAGLCKLTESAVTPEIPEIAAVWVDSAFRGCGVADALVEHQVEIATQRGAEFIGLWVQDRNTGAHGLYQRHGFVRSGHVSLRFADDPSSATCAQWVKRLRPAA